MGCYSLHDLSPCYNNLHEKRVDYRYYKFYLESDIHINRPDYAMVLDLDDKEPVLYHKNFNLTFLETEKDILKKVFSTVKKGELNRIFRIDKQCARFATDNLDLISQVVFRLRFSFVDSQNIKRSLLRNVRFVPKNLNKVQHLLIVVTFTDVTYFLGVSNQPLFDFKFSRRQQYKKFETALEKLRSRINTQLSIKRELTKREFEILELIGKGKTSTEIAAMLNISKNTVSTHRQNLIKKFNVKNTTALLREL
ncbi:MAG: response regulator transcription factor [Aestuariibaculum sp.]